MTQFAWLILLLLAIAFLLRVDIIYYLLYVVLGVYLWSRWFAPRALNNLEATRTFRRRAFLGEVVDISLTLRNKSRLALPWVQLSESVPPELRLEEPIQKVITLRGRETQTHTYHIKGLQRGYYRLGPLRLISGDLFGLVKPRVGLLQPDYLTVYPRIIPLNQLGLPSRLPFGAIASRQRLFEDPARPMGVREFRSGDALHSMNWKASAHTQKLLVRTFQPAISLDTIILLNLNRGDYEHHNWHYSTEWAIVTAASIATHLIGLRQAVGLATNGVDPLRLQEDTRVFDEVTGRLLFETAAAQNGPGLTHYIPPAIEAHNGRPHLMKVLEQLARLDARDTMPFHEWAYGASVKLPWGVTVVAITAQGDEKTSNTLHHMTRRGLNPILIAVEPNANFGLVRQRARRLGFQAFNISDRRDFSPWQRPQVTHRQGMSL
jgi:uncharacterized protein (DUF58 family)